MSKRLTDTELWKKQWFRELPPREKAAFEYIKSQCDNIGLWDPDFGLADFMIGEPVEWDTLPERLHGNVEVLPNGKWWLVDFCSFQHPDLTPDSDDKSNRNKATMAYVRDLKGKGLWDRFCRRYFDGPSTGLEGPSKGPKEQEREQERVKAREEGEIEKTNPTFVVYRSELQKKLPVWPRPTEQYQALHELTDATDALAPQTAIRDGPALATAIVKEFERQKSRGKTSYWKTASWEPKTVLRRFGDIVGSLADLYETEEKQHEGLEAYYRMYPERRPGESRN